MRGKAHSDETKAAVMAALMAGQGVSEVAKQYTVSKAVVSGWKRDLGSDKLEQVRTKKEDEFGELLGKYLRETLITLSVQAEHFRDRTWLKEQSASELAILHGVQTDKAIRLLEAIEVASATDGAASGE